MNTLIKLAVFLSLFINQAVGRYLSEEITYENATNSDAYGGLQDCNCDWRYYKHYEAKGCQILQTNSCGCPINYSCSSLSQSSPQSKVCTYQNMEYKVGEKIKLADKCQVCRCVGGITAHITCRHKECPQLGAVDGENCHLVYDENKCCPSKYLCATDTAENGTASSAISCIHDNVTYPLGSKIYPGGDPCLICECNENWNGVNNSSCYQQECVFEKNKHLLDVGCIPVYHESKCCPIEYYCPERLGFNSLEPLSISLSFENLTQSEDTCIFDGHSYKIGAELPRNNSCIKCMCRVPPDFTCIHQSCPLPPNSEYCDEFYVADQCCPDYDCLLSDSTDNDGTDKGNSTTTEIVCPTPLCADNTCQIGILPGHQCPTCICVGGSREKNIMEPLEQVLDQEYIEMNNDTEDMVVEIQDHSKSNNDSVKEHLSNTFIEEMSKHKSVEKYEGVQNTETALQTNENTEPGDTEYFIQLPSDEAASTDDDENQIFQHEPRQKRSENIQTGSQQQWAILQQDVDPLDTSESSEREREYSEENSDGFEEMKVFGSKEPQVTTAEILELEETDFENVVWSVIVPGCPTPLCANSSCRIGVPHGQRCPTCLCRRQRQP